VMFWIRGIQVISSEKKFRSKEKPLELQYRACGER